MPNRGQAAKNGSSASLLEAVGTAVNASQLSDINPKKYLNKKLVPHETQRFKYLSRLTNHNANSVARSAKQAGVNKNPQDRM